MLNKLLDWFGLGRTFMVGTEKIKVSKLLEKQGLVYNLALEGEESAGTLSATIEVVLPTELADLVIDYIRHTTAPYGCTVGISDKSDEDATKMIIRIPFSPEFDLAIQMVESILIGDLDYQHPAIRSMWLLKTTRDYEDLQDLSYRLDKVQKHYPQTEEERRQGKNIVFKQVKYVHNGHGVNCTQNVSQVTKDYLISHLAMMEQSTATHRGERRLMQITDKTFTLYIFA